ncbi:UNVERIFIED_CONTAM: hypothetical protein RMT77_003549 [Armadillidium vulgare]|nr:Long-chain-fatty-acid--CoA ligase 4 [Armadillidium vulgare]
MSIRGVQTKEGWWVKSTKDGKPYPLNSRLRPLFKSADVTTVGAALDYGANKYGNKPFMGTRRLIAREKVKEDGKILEKLHLGEYRWLTYKEVKDTSDKIGWAIRSLGIKPLDRIAILAETRAEWFMTAMGCLKQRMTVCTLYTTLSDEALVHAINETEVRLVVTSYDLFQRLKKILSFCPLVNIIIVLEDQLDSVSLDGIPINIKVIMFSDLTKQDYPTQGNPVPSPNDTAIIMYTSGSTGTPKGVELNHTNILESVIAYSVQMNVGPDDRYLAFLPLAHIMELATEVALVSLGITMLYSSPHTLTDSSAKILEGTTGDAKIARPTLMNAVPLVLDRVIKSIFSAVEKQGFIKSLIFSSIVKFKPWLDYVPFAGAILDYLIFNKVKEELGGQVKRMVIGGAPVPPQTHSLMRTIFGCSVQVGYGSTETASCTTGMDEDDVTTGEVGAPNLGVILKLQSWEEGGYLTTDLPYPRGEIIAGGPCVAKGYFKQTQETVGAFFEEDGQRWFRTGDIGELDDKGVLKIIDRKKDLVKLKHGEYVSLGNAEAKLKTLPIVDNICVFADPMQDKTVAVIVPTTEKLLHVSKLVGVEDEGVTIDELCSDVKVKEAILKELQSHGRKHGLTRWEIPAALHLTPDPWTPDTGLVTAALKLRRKQLGQHYQIMVREMYSRLD